MTLVMDLEVVSVDEFTSSAEVARRFGVTARTVVRWIDEGKLPGAKKLNPLADNSPFLIPVASVEAFAEKREQQDGSKS